MLFGGIDQHGALAGLSALPVAVFEFSLGVWLIVKGFDPDAVAALESKDDTVLDYDPIASSPGLGVEAARVTSVGPRAPRN